MSTLPLFDRDTVIAINKRRSLRPYQAKAIQKLRDLIREGKKRILLVGPTGCGKMVIMASIIQTSTVPVLFVCHRLELIEGCVRELAHLGITNVGVIRADDERENPECTVQVASIQTLARRKKPPAGLVLIDEAHRTASDSYQELLEHYRDAIVIGFTATPTRLDGRPLGNTFEHLEIVTTYAELLKEGFIVGPECYAAPLVPDLSSVPVGKHSFDFDDAALGEVMRRKELVGDLLDHWLRMAHMYPGPGGHGLVEGSRRRTFIFAASVQHSLDICERFESAGVRIAHLDADTKEGERKRIVEALGTGDLEAVSNVNILTEGVDVPSAKCAVFARPTMSLTLHRQMGGRIFRLWHPGCPSDCVAHPSLVPLILDHAGNIDRLGFCHEDMHWELHKRATRLVKHVPAKICRKCFAYVPVAKMVCPYCNSEFPPAAQDPNVPGETQEQLVRRNTSTEEMQRSFYENMVQLARQRGNKPGFAAAKFKEHYGRWPPWAWSESTRASFASDPVWQAALDGKEVRKKRQEEKAAAEEAKAAGELGVSADEYAAEMAVGREEQQDDGETLSGWLREQGIE